MEAENLIVTQPEIVTSNIGRGGRRYRPYAFTELGIAMLSSVLNSPKATQVNIVIMRTFVKLRHALSHDKQLAEKIEKLEKKVDLHDSDIRLILADIRRLFGASESTYSNGEVPRIRGFTND